MAYDPAAQAVEKSAAETRAAAQDAHGDAHGFDPLKPSPGLFIWSAVTFIVLFVMLKKLAWGPILKMVDERESKIRGDLDRAEKARIDSESTLRLHEAKLAEAAQAARETVEAARVRAEQAAVGIATAAKVEAEAVLVRARAQIESDKQRALADIKTAVVELSMAVTREIVKRTSSQEDHARIADEMIHRVKEAG